jgi:hypothetical protein
MNGLLEFMSTPAGQGLLGAVAGGLAGARRGTPVNNVGRGLLGGVASFGNALERDQQAQQFAAQEQDRAQSREFRGLQMGQMRAQMDQQKAQQDWKTGLPEVLKQSQEATYGASDAGPTMAPPDPQKLQSYLMDPRSPYADKMLESQLFPKAADFKEVGGALVRIGPDGKVTEAYKAPEKIDYNQLLIPDGKGGMMVNTAYLTAKKEVASAGRPSVTVENRIENKAGESVSKEVGPILEKSLTAAEGAMRVLDASDRVVRAIDSGQVITGPLANARVTGLQIGQMLGVGGKDAAEVLANTRQAIRGLSEMTLQGRKEMSGQGAITDRESALAEKATSGDINNLTAEEVRILANASARAARYRIESHRTKVNNARQLPGMQNITPFFDVPDMQPPAQPAPTGAPRPGMVQDGYRFKGGNPADPKSWELVR